MYQLVVVDDEKFSRSVVEKYIRSAQRNFEVAGAFSNGEEALAFIEQHSVDVVITDIKMPKMDGMELCAQIRSRNKKCKIVILSGYGEFSYAQQAIKYGVCHYLLKPIDMEELCEALRKIEKQLDGENAVEVHDEQSRRLNQEQFFVDAILGVTADRKEMPEAFARLEFPFEYERAKGKIIKFQVKDYERFIQEVWNYEKDRLSIAVVNLLETCGENIYAYSVVHHGDTMIFAVVDGGYPSTYIEQMQDTARELLSLELRGEILCQFESPAEISQKFSMLKTLDTEVEMLVSYLKTGDKNSAQLMLKRLVYEYAKMGENSFRKLLQKLSVVLEGGSDFEHELTELYNQYPIGGLAEAEEFSKRLLQLAGSGEVRETDSLIQKIKKFVEDNYTNDISREDVAGAVFLNANYFSRYFSMKTGQSFSDYLLEVRMHKAVELLNNSGTIYEIAKRVGYNDYRHFLRTFKKYTGYTPSEYRRSVLGKADDMA